MKKITLMAAAALLWTAGLQAQTRRNAPDEIAAKDTTRHRRAMMKELNLTPEQKEAMKKQREANRSKIEAIKNDASLNEEQKREKIQELRKEQQAKAGQVLSAEQKAKIKNAQRKGRDADFKHQQYRKENALDLSPDQQSKMKAFNEKYKAEFTKIKNDPQLSKEQKMEKFKELKAQQKEERRSILTPEQKTKLDKMEKQSHKNKNKNGRLKSPNARSAKIPGTGN